LATKEVLPIFVSTIGEYDAALAQWLLLRAARGKREEFGEVPPALPVRDLYFDRAVAMAQSLVAARLLELKEQLTIRNQERLADDLRKMEELFDYKERAARDKLSAVQRVWRKVAQSDDPDVQKIVPVWAKNVEYARRVLDLLSGERERRLKELRGRDQVSAKSEVIAGSYVKIRDQASSGDQPVGK
jgi:hypothetical protein